MVYQTWQPNFKNQWTELLTTQKTFFLDDILIVSKGSETEHEKLVETVLKKLDDKHLALNISNCELSKNQLDWLGNHLLESGVSPKFTKTEAIQNLNPPKSLKQLGSFL